MPTLNAQDLALIGSLCFISSMMALFMWDLVSIVSEGCLSFGNWVVKKIKSHNLQKVS